MKSKDMLKTHIKDNEYWHNKAPLGRKPNWEIRKKHGGMMITAKVYREFIQQYQKQKAK